MYNLLKKIFFIIFYSFLFSNNNIILRGIIIDSINEKPIPSVNISLNNSIIGTESDNDGFFVINNIKDKTIKLTFSHIGYKSIDLEVKLPQKQLLTILMKEAFFSMDELVVTSTRTEKLHKNVPIATEVINSKEIQTSGALNLADFLSQRSGISMSTSVEGASVLNILGMDSRYILILLDGQPITGRFNSRVSLDQIPTSNIDQIEIIKGPNSSLYGGEAMGGVINIITNSDEGDENIIIKYRYGGSKNNFNLGNAEKGNRNFQSLFKYTFKNLKSIFNFDIDLINTNKEIEYLDINDIKKWNLKSNFYYKNNLNLIFQTYQDNQTGNSGLMKNDTYIQRNSFNINHKINNLPKLKINLSLWMQNYSRRYKQLNPFGEIDSDDLTNENSIEYELNIVKSINENNLSFGTEINKSTYKSERVGNNKQTINAISMYSQYDIKSFFGFQTLIGLRLDQYSDNNIVSSPRIGLMYLINDRWKFRTTIGKGFRAPTFMEKFIDWNHIQFGYKVIGNENLIPEISKGFTLGIEYYHPIVYHISLMYYYTKFNNMINDYVFQSGQPTILSYENINKATYNGIEIQGKWNISNQATSSWNINLVDNRDSNGEIIPNTQPLTANTKIDYQTKNGNLMFSFLIKWTASYNPKVYNPELGQYTKSKRESFSIMNINLQYNLLKNIMIGLGSRNLKDFTDEKYGPFIGRENYIEIKYIK